MSRFLAQVALHNEGDEEVGRLDSEEVGIRGGVGGREEGDHRLLHERPGPEGQERRSAEVQPGIPFHFPVHAPPDLRRFLYSQRGCQIRGEDGRPRSQCLFLLFRILQSRQLGYLPVDITI